MARLSQEFEAEFSGEMTADEFEAWSSDIIKRLGVLKARKDVDGVVVQIATNGRAPMVRVLKRDKRD